MSDNQLEGATASSPTSWLFGFCSRSSLDVSTAMISANVQSMLFFAGFARCMVTFLSDRQ